MPGWKMAARWSRPSRCCPSPRRTSCALPPRARWMFMPSRRWRGRAPTPMPTITRPTPNLDVALPLPDSLPADLLARRPDILAAQGAGRSGDQGPRGGPCRFLSRHQSGGAGGLPGHRAFQPVHRQFLHHGRGPGACICRSSMPASSAPNMPAPPPISMLAVADYNGAVVDAIKQTADAMTQVKSLAAQRGAAAGRGGQRRHAPSGSPQDRYRSGLATQLPMLTAESTLLQARQALAGVVAAGRAAAHHPAADGGRRLRCRRPADAHIAKRYDRQSGHSP